MAINELLDRAKIKLPEWINRHIREEILGLRISFFGDHDLECGYDKDEIWWFDKKIFNAESREGIYIGTGFDNTWDTITAQTRDEGGWIYVYFGTGNLAKKDTDRLIRSWQNHFDKHNKELIKKGIILRPHDEDNNYLAAFYLFDSINLDVIREGQFPDRMIEEVKKFTLAVVPIIRSFRKKINPHVTH